MQSVRHHLFILRVNIRYLISQNFVERFDQTLSERLTNLIAGADCCRSPLATSNCSPQPLVAVSHVLICPGARPKEKVRFLPRPGSSVRPARWSQDFGVFSLLGRTRLREPLLNPSLRLLRILS